MALTYRAVVLALVGLVPVAVWPQGDTARWWLLVTVLLVGLDAVLAPSPRALTLTREGPGQVRLGDDTATSVLVTNGGRRRVRGALRDAWPPSAGASAGAHRLDVPAGERTRLTTAMHPTRRGDRRAHRVTIRATGPLGLAARQRSFEVPGQLRTLHPFPARKHLPSRLAVLRQLDGRAALRTRGQGTEFDSLREYVDGDDVRSIDWRATARRQHLVVRTWQPEQHRRIVIVVDTSRTSAGRVDDSPRLDAAMDAALLLTALAGHARDRVQVLAGDRVVQARVGGADRAKLLHDTISTLAPVESRLVEADWGLLATEVRRLGTQRALVVLLTPLESSAVEQGLIPVLPSLCAHHRVVVASVADPAVARMRAARETVAQVYDAAAAERTTTLRRRTAAALASLGVDVLDEPPDQLPVRLADHYLMLKRQGLL
ncbi:Uncharacterized conserved protein, DUF58 family, contains vWF domain [Pedococcus dokdonensis]|uniref:Uncharacterized conserved protein, DUF58 family, contains vWF domain n=1 Tax=Pedococcus dokdonensis TaxID=443156 RepID=A0A1H0RM29_9MICO|nr:DUF58 domain-containing protein [Pedococcus dokdonensis]SDP30440.1 Uncharacterized conserved protein, DUF58 family, contains vWF domain [Pedococcus dokdonensis]